MPKKQQKQCAMFSSFQALKRKTPENGINREEFIAHLVDEYYTTTNIEHQEQVTANLANFAYDPINWNYLKTARTLDLFIEILEVPNERLQLHALAGLCNMYLDPQTQKFVTQPSRFALVRGILLKSENVDLLLNCLTLCYQLLAAEVSAALKGLIVTPEVLQRAAALRDKHSDQRLKNLATIFLEDFGTRKELYELKAARQHVRKETP